MRFETTDRRFECLHRKTGLTVLELASSDHILRYIAALNATRSLYISSVVLDGTSFKPTMNRLYFFSLLLALLTNVKNVVIKLA